MAQDALIANLTKLYKLHEQLLEIAMEKTDVLKERNIDGLQTIMREEQKYTTAITQLESERQRAAKAFLKKESNENITISDCIAAATPEAAATLKKLEDRLRAVIEKLQEQNDLNKQLVYQSLQYVNITMEMFQPSAENTVYSKPNEKKQTQREHSFFDSKA